MRTELILIIVGALVIAGIASYLILHQEPVEIKPTFTISHLAENYVVVNSNGEAVFISISFSETAQWAIDHAPKNDYMIKTPSMSKSDKVIDEALETIHLMISKGYPWSIISENIKSYGSLRIDEYLEKQDWGDDYSKEE